MSRRIKALNGGLYAKKGNEKGADLWSEFQALPTIRCGKRASKGAKRYPVARQEKRTKGLTIIR